MSEPRFVITVHWDESDPHHGQIGDTHYWWSDPTESPADVSDWPELGYTTDDAIAEAAGFKRAETARHPRRDDGP